MSAVRHRRPLEIIKQAFDQLVRNAGSRDSVAISVVEKHEELGMDRTTGYFFDRHHDISVQIGTWAKRIFRWVDLENSNNRMTVDFLPSALALMPEDMRLQVINEILLPAGLCASLISKANETAQIADLIQKHVKESAEASSAVVGLIDGFDKAELLNAQKELLESQKATQESLDFVQAALAKGDVK